ncbi:MAG: hypothetical protein K2W96_09010, partial [Gemmataceae bacterium]|nr:hypothetical protein [Gemmataceae bacterium]
LALWMPAARGPSAVALGVHGDREGVETVVLGVMAVAAFVLAGLAALLPATGALIVLGLCVAVAAGVALMSVSQKEEDAYFPVVVFSLSLVMVGGAEGASHRVRAALVAGGAWAVLGAVAGGLLFAAMGQRLRRSYLGWLLENAGGFDVYSSRLWRAGAMAGGWSAAVVGAVVVIVGSSTPSEANPVGTAVLAGAVLGVLATMLFARSDRWQPAKTTLEEGEARRMPPPLLGYAAGAALGAAAGAGLVFVPQAMWWPILGGIGGALAGQQLGALAE